MKERTAKSVEMRPKTCAYLRLKIEQKRTHIRNERKRLEILIGLLKEQEEN